MNEKQEIAKDIMKYIKRRLLLHLRYLNRAIYALSPREHAQINGIGTDGQFLYYDTSYLIHSFQSDRNRLNREYLHSLLHCIFRHFDVRPDIDQVFWNVSCDIAVENIIQELNLPDMKISEECGQRTYITLLTGKVKLLSAEKIYHFLVEKTEDMGEIASGAGCNNVRELLRENSSVRQLFCRDDHRFWYQPVNYERRKGLEKESLKAKIFEDLDVTDPDELRILPKVELTDEWKKIADIIKVDLETESVNRGVHAGSLAWQIRIAGRDHVDYRKFLRKFAHYRETLGSNPEEFDYVYYTYGLKLYHDMPLIEPLEYREDRRIQEFAIAIDTSGSISQNRILRFLESTVSILKSKETFDHKMKIYLIQCDAQIQHVTVIESVRQLQEYWKELTVYGYGGTDFRPVFSYLAQLQEEGQIHHLEGLLYFTDGLGIYPTHPVPYKTAFIFTEPELEVQRDFPQWAMKLILTEDEIDLL